MNDLAIVVVGPDEKLRRQVCDVAAIQDVRVDREFAIYPDTTRRQTLDSLTDRDVLLIELDSDPESALELIRQVCSSSPDDSITVMAYSADKDADLLLRCMRAGAREFLTVPVDGDQLSQALEQAAGRRATSGETRPKRRGRTVAFLGAKGGVGSTTLAANYALALQKESGEDVCLVDLNTQLGDAAMSLGLEPRFSVLDAVQSASRLDHDFLSALLVEHSSGLSVLGGPDTYEPEREVDGFGLDGLVDLLGETFAYTVLDAGAGGEFTAKAVQRADLVYLVVQADVPTLRNAQRLIAHFDSVSGTGPRMELVLNRAGAKEQLSGPQVESTLGAKVRWTVPNDFRRVQDALNRGVPIAENDSPVSGALASMARAFTGKRVDDKPSGWLSVFRKAPAKG